MESEQIKSRNVECRKPLVTCDAINLYLTSPWRGKNSQKADGRQFFTK